MQHRSELNLTSESHRMDVVRAELATEDTAAHIKQRVDVLQAQFREQMDVIYDLVAEDYLGEVTDAYYSLDDSFSIPEIEVSSSRRVVRYSTEWHPS